MHMVDFYMPSHDSGGVLWFQFPDNVLMGKFHQFLTELSAHHSSIFWFPDDSLSKYQWIFMNLGMCNDIVEIWFGIANGQTLSIFHRLICLPYVCIFISR